MSNVGTTTTGVKASYTAPVGKRAVVSSVSWYNRSGTPTVQLQLVRAGVTFILRQDTASFRDLVSVALDPGDTLQLNVTVAGTGSAADAVISGIVEV